MGSRCTECNAEAGAVVERSTVNHRVHKAGKLGGLGSAFWTAAHVVHLLDTGRCQTCERHYDERGPSRQMSLLGDS